MRIYVASSWRNRHQPGVVAELRQAGHEVYDFREPEPGNRGFHWSEIDPDWQQWSAARYVQALEHPIARAGYDLDFRAMCGADACVLVTEWDEFERVDLKALSKMMHTPVLFDGRNVFDVESMRAAGFVYHSIGRVPVASSSASIPAPLVGIEIASLRSQ